MKKKIWLLIFILLSFVGINNVDALDCSLVDTESNRTIHFDTSNATVLIDGINYTISDAKSNVCPAAGFIYSEQVQEQICPTCAFINTTKSYLKLWYENENQLSELMSKYALQKADSKVLINGSIGSMAYCEYSMLGKSFAVGYVGDGNFFNTQDYFTTTGGVENMSITSEVFETSLYQQAVGQPPKCNDLYYTTVYTSSGVGTPVISYTIKPKPDDNDKNFIKLAPTRKIEYGQLLENESFLNSCVYTLEKSPGVTEFSLAIRSNQITVDNVDKVRILNFSYSDVNGVCPDVVYETGDTLYLSPVTTNSSLVTKYVKKKKGTTATDIIESTAMITGERYQALLCELSPYLKKAGVGNNLTLQIDSNPSLPISSWGCNNTYTCTGSDCEKNFEYEMNQKIKDIANYCNAIYDDYTDAIKNSDSMIVNRVKECISFDRYYQGLVEGGYVDNLSDGCGILSPDAFNIIEEILDIIKIAGPLIAIGLGMIDFARAVVAGDPDKELKSAGTRFLKRIIAAVVLLLVPIILSFIMNIFLKNKPGYDADNPFCNVVDWDHANDEVIESEQS